MFALIFLQFYNIFDLKLSYFNASMFYILLSFSIYIDIEALTNSCFYNDASSSAHERHIWFEILKATIVNGG